MFGTIESANSKIGEKFSLIRQALNLASTLTGSRDTWSPTHELGILDKLAVSYGLATAAVLSNYYSDGGDSLTKTREYYRTVVEGNIVFDLNALIARAYAVARENIAFLDVLGSNYEHITGATENTAILMKEYVASRNSWLTVRGLANRAACIKVKLVLETYSYETCECGTRMDVIPETSELRCGSCGMMTSIIGAVFRDDQFYPQDGQKAKHSSDGISRHYRFWIDRLQAQETKQFTDTEISRIEDVIKRECYVKRDLTCEQMRTILKDSSVKLTDLNDHVPLLVKIMGGRPPPQLSFQENRSVAVRFGKVMRLYNKVVPCGGNKPYYPYFIYKIIEHVFRDCPDKLRLLEYIHLQSRETVIKNDKTYEQICGLAMPDDGLVYRPTDPGYGL